MLSIGKKHMSKILILLLFFFICLSSNNVLANDITVTIVNNKNVIVREVPVLIDSKEVKTTPPSYIDYDSTMVPLRFISENFGDSKVYWHQKNKQATIKNKNNTIVLTINSDVALVNNRQVKIIGGTPSLVSFGDLENANTMVPLRFLFENLGFTVGYDEVRRLPSITSKTVSNEIQKDKPVELPIKPSNAKKKVTIDAGHGGHDPGAVNGVETEKDIALKVSKKVNYYLNKSNIETEMTRDTDTFVELRERANIANSNNSDVFISIHLNSFTTPEAEGIETLHSGSEEGKKLSKLIQDELIKNTSGKDRGIKQRSELAVLRGTSMPAALVEVGFISNDKELELLKQDVYQDILARSIANGIIKYLN